MNKLTQNPYLTLTFHKTWIALAVLLVIACVLWFQNHLIPDLGAGAYEYLLSQEPVHLIFKMQKWGDQSPLYPWCLHFWTKLGNSPTVIKAFNLIMQLLALIALFVLSQKVSKNPLVWLGACVLMIVSPSSLWIVRDGRMYGLMELLSILSMISILSYFESKKWIPLILFFVTILLSIYNHYVSFWSSTFVYVFILLTLYLESRSNAGTKGLTHIFSQHRKLIAFTCALPILVLPQIFRVLSYLSDPRAPKVRQEWLDAVVAAIKHWVWFLFVNANLGSKDWEKLFPIVIILMFVLIIFSFSKMDKRSKCLFGVMFLSGALLLISAHKLDFNNRYLVYLRPLLFISMSMAAFEVSRKNKDSKKRYIGGLRLLCMFLFVVFVTWNIACYMKKIPEKPTEWTAVLRELDRLDQPGTTYYMGGRGEIVEYTVKKSGFKPGIRIRKPIKDERSVFASNLAKGRDFAFIHFSLPDDAVNRWMYATLKSLKYHMRVVGAGLKAWHFEATQKPKPVTVQSVVQGSGSLGSKIVGWVNERLEQYDRTSLYEDQKIREALVARVNNRGVIHESREYLSYGPGEGGVWQLGLEAWMAVETKEAKSQSVSKKMIHAHPYNGEHLVIAFPKVFLTDELEIIHGLADSGFAGGEGADVRMTLYMNGKFVKHFISEDKRGWNLENLDTSEYAGEYVDLTFVMTTKDANRRHFCFNFMPVGYSLHQKQPLDLLSSKMSEQIEQLDVYRIRWDGHRIEPIGFDPTRYVAWQMHGNVQDENEEGWLEDRWVLSYWEWNAVGKTRQRSHGVLNQAVWAHPLNRTVLHIESQDILIGKSLHGLYGFADYSLVGKHPHPVKFVVLLDNKEVFRAQAQRKRGWEHFTIPTTGAEKKLEVQVSALKDIWAHFAFDLWSEE